MLRIVTAIIALIAVTAQAQAQEPYAKTSRYVTSEDGTRVAVEIYRPATGDGKVPVLMLQRNAEADMDRELETVRYFTRNGYAVVRQFRRGTGASFGTQLGFLNLADGQDAKAVIEWAGSQPWSNGKVGAMGCSNQGGWQWVAAHLAPRHLVTIAPYCASASFFDDAISRNGVSIFAVGDRPTYNGECSDQVVVGKLVDGDTDGALAKAAAEQHRCNAPFLGQYQANMHRDTVNRFLGYAPGLVDNPIMHTREIQRSGVKVLALVGWFDASPGGDLIANRLYGAHVVVGPWQHCNIRDPGFANSQKDLLALQLKWFDATLKGAANGALSEPSILYYTMNAPAGTEWRTATSWPVAGMQPATYFFAAEKSGSIDSRNDGSLTTAPPTSTSAADSYQPDYSVEIFGGQYSPLFRWWTGDMRDSVDRKAMTYTMAPLTAPMQVTGNPIVKLWATTSGPDADFIAILEDVAPDGKSTYVTDGMLRASRRKLATPPWGDQGLPFHSNMTADDLPMVAGQPAELEFAMIPTSWVFRKDHRLRVSIVNAGGRALQPLPGLDTANPPTIDILRDKAHPSSVILPVIAN